MSVIECYLVGLVLGAGFSGIVASLSTLHNAMASTIKENLRDET